MNVETSTATDVEETQVVSKVLVLEPDGSCGLKIRDFCQACNLHPLRAGEDNLLGVLASNVDLGGVMIPERLGASGTAGIELGRRIHALRPELPIFLRRHLAPALEGISQADRRCFAGGYTIDSINTLRPLLDEFIFSMIYPNRLLRGIHDMTRTSVSSQFRELDLSIEAPYIVRDRVIFGEIFTLIPLETTWCRGYMTLQTEESSLQGIVRAGRTYLDIREADDFRSLNSVLGEVTNLIWGAFKNRYSDQGGARSGSTAQVPIIVNHLHRYISFGSGNPQLCFKATLSDRANPNLPVMTILQRFVFNLNWSPEDFRENEVNVDSLVDSGELELF